MQVFVMLIELDLLLMGCLVLLWALKSEKGTVLVLWLGLLLITVDAVGLNNFVTVHWPECDRLMMTAIISSVDVVACFRKYLVEASMARGLKFFIIIGMMAIMFISNPIQASSQWELVIKIIVPKMTVTRIMTEVMGFISTGRI